MSKFFRYGFVLFVIFFFFISPRAFASETPPPFQFAWGSPGTGNGQFGDFIHSVAIDINGNVYVADTNNNRIQKFAADGQFITQWAVTSPLDVAVDPSGNIFVTEQFTHRVVKFTSDGTFISVFQQFDDARDVAFDSAGNVYILSHHFGIIYKFQTDGTPVISWSASPFPLGLTIDHNDNIYVALNRGQGPVMKYTSDGTFLNQFNFNAYQMTVDSNNNIYGTDIYNHRVLKFTPDGNLLTEWGTFGASDGQFNNPTGLAVNTTNGNIYIGDALNSRIQVFGNAQAQYNFSGFFQPVANLPVLNSLKAGSAVPLKFSLNGDKGLAILEAGYPKSEQIACDSQDVVNGIEETVTAGTSSLSYDASADQYTYVWKTDKLWVGTCRQFVLKLNDSTYHQANFTFKN